MGPHLEHTFNISPITSLAFLNVKSSDQSSHPLLIAGEGPFIKAISTALSKSLELPGVIRIFARERVHGITLTTDESRILFWGGRSISIATVSSLFSPGLKPEEIQAQDWILYASFLPTINEAIKIIAITAHNSLLIYTPESGWAELASGERCMLYSAHLLHLPANPDSGESERILVAAGTVFGEILLWSTTLTSKCPAELHYRLLGHEGSIFGVNISPLYAGRRYLSSCSDDRTVRIWDVSHLPVSSTPEEVKDGTLKNTGFGYAHTPSTQGGKCISLGWGHTARIWGVRFLPDPTESGQIRIISISEDLTSKFWEFTPSNAGASTIKGFTVELINTATYLLHNGKHIWSYALDFKRGLLATGGADGRVGLVEYNSTKGKEEEWDMQTVISNIGGSCLKGGKDTFKSYAVLDSNRFLVTTSLGRLFTYNLTTKAWKLVSQCESLNSWSLVASWQDEGMVALGNGRGEVGLCFIDKGGEIEWWLAGGEGEHGKVGGVWTSVGPGGENYEKSYNILTTTLSTSVFTLHTFARINGIITHFPRVQFTAPSEENTKKFLPTSLYISQLNSDSLLFLGSRNGALVVYSRATANILGIYHNLHSTDAITSITPYPSSLSSPSDSISVKTVGRDGGLAIHNFTLYPEPSLTTIHSATPTNCNVIEGASSSSNKHIWGFRGKHFFVHDGGQGVDIAVVACGGAHRAWCLYWEEIAGWLVWTKASKVHIAHLPLHPQRPLTPGLHGREIKSIAFAPSTGILATGAEDTLIRLSSVNTATGNIESIAVVKWHTTGVQQLAWSACGGWLFSSGGVEELAVWKVRDGGVVGEAKGPCVDGDLRILGLGVVDVHGKDGKKTGFVVGVGLSDSSIKIYYYSLISRAFTLLLQGRYKTNCILHSTFTVHPTTSKIHLFIAATDGYITAYDLSSPLRDFGFVVSQGGFLRQESVEQMETMRLPEILLTKRTHQSGVKAFEAIVDAVGDVVIYTGGDDCALGITIIKLSEEESLRVETFMVPRAHASAVTAIVAMGSTLVSSAVSQEIKMWNIDTARDIPKVRLLEEGYSCVADVAGAVGMKDREGEGGWVILGGVGVDFWKVK